jgi:hypothetical protein
VIVVLADQHDEAPASAGTAGRRHALALADQRPLVDQVRRADATDIKQFSLGNGFAATVSGAERQRLATDPPRPRGAAERQGCDAATGEANEAGPGDGAPGHGGSAWPIAAGSSACPVQPARLMRVISVVTWSPGK